LRTQALSVFKVLSPSGELSLFQLFLAIKSLSYFTFALFARNNPTFIQKSRLRDRLPVDWGNTLKLPLEH